MTHAIKKSLYFFFCLEIFHNVFFCNMPPLWVVYLCASFLTRFFVQSVELPFYFQMRRNCFTSFFFFIGFFFFFKSLNSFNPILFSRVAPATSVKKNFFFFGISFSPYIKRMFREIEILWCPHILYYMRFLLLDFII